MLSGTFITINRLVCRPCEIQVDGKLAARCAQH